MFLKIFLSAAIAILALAGVIFATEVVNEPSTLVMLLGFLSIIGLPMLAVYMIGKLWGFFKKGKKE